MRNKYQIAYKEAEKYIEEGNYSMAYETMSAAPGSSAEVVDEMIYKKATEYYNAGEYSRAKELYDSIGDEEQSKRCIEVQAGTYERADEYLKAKELYDSIGDNENNMY